MALYFFQIEDQLFGDKNSIRRQLKDDGNMTASCQVDCLLEWATDENILAMTYFGWGAYM